jgi:hypothetical protein
MGNRTTEEDGSVADEPYGYEIELIWDSVLRTIILDFRQGDAHGQAYLGRADARILGEALIDAATPGAPGAAQLGRISQSVRITCRHDEP